MTTRFTYKVRTLTQDFTPMVGAVRIELVEGVPRTRRASTTIIERIETLMARSYESLTLDEVAYERWVWGIRRLFKLG